MSFDFTTLITDRTQADVNRVKQIAEKIKNGTASESELAEFNSAAMKGAYNYTDLNRVTAAMEALKAKLQGYGYAVPGYQRIKVPHPSAGGGSRLPEGYTELAWIESTGTQYFDTGFKHNQNTRVVMDVQMTTVPSGNNVWLFDGRNGTGANVASKSVFFYATSTSLWTTDYDGSSSRKNFSGIAATDRLNIDYNKNVCTINGQTVTHTAGYFQSNYNLFLLADNRAGTAMYPASAMLFSCQIYDAAALIRDYVPCIDPSGEVGLYDLVTAVFFGNAGTGSFAAGDVVEVSGGQGGEASVSMTNLIADGSFETTGTWITWSADALVAEQALFGTKSLKLTGDQLANVSVETPIVGHKYYGREYIKTDGEVTIGDGRFEVHGGDGDGLNWVYGWNQGNYPTWTIQSAIHKIDVVNASSYVMRTFKVGGSGTAYIDGIMLIDLTAAFGSGYEPDKEWCDKYIPFFEGTQFVELPPRYEWKEYDAPTADQMAVYLLNVSIIRSVLAVIETTPEVPADMVNLTYAEANNIEQILKDIDLLITNMIAAWFYSGDLYSVEV